MKLKVNDNDKNYVASIVRLNYTNTIPDLDRLVSTSFFGFDCLIGKDYPIGELYAFIPSGSVLSAELVKKNNLYRDSELNSDKSKKGYLDTNCRIKAIKFKNVQSCGLLLKLDGLAVLGIKVKELAEGQEFNQIDNVEICKKYVLPERGSATQAKKNKLLDNRVDSLMFPEHFSTLHALKYVNELDLTRFVLTVKIHGASGRTALTLVKRKLSWIERIAKFCGAKLEENEYQYVVGSRKCIKSIGFATLENKNHFYKEDIWTKISDECFNGKLHHGEVIYWEVVGKTFEGGDIQKNYHYGFNKPTVFIYRISHINKRGFEHDLSWLQVKARANELGIPHVKELYYGGLSEYCRINNIKEDNVEFVKHLEQVYLNKASYLDPKVIEEGVCIALDKYPKPQIFKYKSSLFLIHESKLQDEQVEDIDL